MNAQRKVSAAPELIASAGCGSAIVEAVYALAGQPLTVRHVPYEALAGDAALRARNPLAQVPTLLLADGSVLTESAAIVLHVADGAPGAGIAPPPGDPARPAFLRWLQYCVGAIYPTFHNGDLIAAHSDAASAQAIADALARRREDYWRHVEAAAGAPWFLGQQRSALDVVIAVMARWAPGLDWFAAHTPRLHAIAQRCAQEPALRAVFASNFPG